MNTHEMTTDSIHIPSVGQWWVTSDTHFKHKRISDLAKRPFDTTETTIEMDEALIANHNSVVGKDDFVIHLGDLAMGAFQESLDMASRMNGQKFLVAGNHDRFWSGWKRKNQQITSREKYEASGFTLMDENITINIEGHNALLASHFPYWESSEERGVRYAEYRPHDDGKTLLLHGHTHSPDIFQEGFPRQFHVGVDAHNLFPVEGKQIMEWVIRMGA